MYFARSELTLSQTQFLNAKILLWQFLFHSFFHDVVGFFCFVCFIGWLGVFLHSIFQKAACLLSLFFFHNLIYVLLYFIHCKNCTSWYIFWNDTRWLEDLLTYLPLNNYILRWGNCTRLKCILKWYSDELLNIFMFVCIHLWCERLVAKALS